MSRPKLHYILNNNGIAPYFKQQLVNKVSGSDCFSIPIFESLNEATQKSEWM